VKKYTSPSAGSTTFLISSGDVSPNLSRLVGTAAEVQWPELTVDKVVRRNRKAASRADPIRKVVRDRK
jgi:hypothetical protein